MWEFSASLFKKHWCKWTWFCTLSRIQNTNKKPFCCSVSAALICWILKLYEIETQWKYFFLDYTSIFACFVLFFVSFKQCVRAEQLTKCLFYHFHMLQRCDEKITVLNFSHFPFQLFSLQLISFTSVGFFGPPVWPKITVVIICLFNNGHNWETLSFSVTYFKTAY